MAEQREYGGLDYFRILCAIFVIAIHTAPLATINKEIDFAFTYILGRIAVPFFFMVTGFFFFQKISNDRQKNVEFLKSFILKITKLYLFSILLYIPVNIYTGYFTHGFRCINLVKDILFNGTFYHLWYFPSVILGISISFILYRTFSTKVIYTIVSILFLIGLFGDSYFGISKSFVAINHFYHFIFAVFDYTRNGLFFAPIFIMMGALIAKDKEQLISFKKSMSGFLLSAFFMIGEGMLLHTLNLQRHNSMYFFLIPSMFFLFQLLLHLKISNNQKMRSISLWVYIIHPLCIILIRGFGKATHTTALLVDHSLIHFLAVTVLSFAISIIIERKELL